MDLKSKIILISGPTASGKSSFAIKVAKKVDGEVVVKKTEWFLLVFDGEENIPLVPDTSEGITDCRWFSFDELIPVLLDSHERIRYLIDFFLNMPYYKEYCSELGRR